ncbi:hypothetical protein EVA_10045 [gut metagenome]|uniref:Uncharacterized protein n=1 Tax=gut metagenome TaxID=749906 RepID=J9GPE3_9ZZZZ
MFSTLRPSSPSNSMHSPFLPPEKPTITQCTCALRLASLSQRKVR